MIKKIYLIQAHQYPHQLLRMINSLQDTDVVFYIHIDIKSDLNLFTSVIKSDNVFFIKDRVDCIWGDFSQVKATLNLLKNTFDGKYNNKVLGTYEWIKDLEYIKFVNNIKEAKVAFNQLTTLTNYTVYDNELLKGKFAPLVEQLKN
ncbi:MULTISPECIES: beta-1,6-N-acetylglucosaminyltransferase [unclassified Empedobacter]|uniref:beta-1,6-N-acetylglucosaminyltransferase n=1 Tax=unclassified Empedobacter TaxID=2643773 RepID=UPI002448F9E9|nr:MULTISPECIES: beta-1,6-N-acetylglucosaminyltransferase [unclassified Empedobacter]MDH2207311.1 beta-1,6-N-acetylglucosaminyltransferase [Empedobacter sp. GD03644]